MYCSVFFKILKFCWNTSLENLIRPLFLSMFVIYKYNKNTNELIDGNNHNKQRNTLK